ncbi:hypothetical protein [Bacillus salipaludis]|uniref:Uncharacterized protein n=1 Tax=Bacillus salipaludis TaxID=2547811 RepID=A0ABW8RK76_9BACI
MKWGPVFVSILIMIFMSLYQWPKLKKNKKREKAAFLSLLILGWALAILLIIFPDIPGPTQMIDWIYKPFGKILEK